MCTVLQERARAVIVLTNGAERFTMDAMRTFLAEKGVARQYRPELRAELPHTAGGTIRTFAPRDMVAGA